MKYRGPFKMAPLAIILSLLVLLFSFIWIAVRNVFGGFIQGGRDKLMEKKAKKHKTKLSISILIEMDKMFQKDYIFDLINNAKLCVEFKDIPRSEPYSSGKSVIKTNLHNGQLKLLISEIQFLSMFGKELAYAIYAGSAPSNKMGILYDMFPWVKFILIDPAEHRIMFPSFVEGRTLDQYDDEFVERLVYFKCSKGNRFDLSNRKVNYWVSGTKATVMNRNSVVDRSVGGEICEMISKSDERIFIIEDYMTNKLAEVLTGLTDRPVYFISDIRTVEEGTFPSNAHVDWNNAMQYSWVKILNPVKYMLKFHPPFLGSPIIIEKEMAADIAVFPVDNVKKFAGGKYSYLKAEVMNLQAYAPPSSTELRLIGSGLDLADYNAKEYEDKLYYFNTYHRNIGAFNEYSEYIDFDVGIDKCADCALMCHVIRGYYDKFYNNTTKDNVIGLVKIILNTIGRTLLSDFTLHGNFSIPKSSKVVGAIGSSIMNPTDIAELLFVQTAVGEFSNENYQRIKNSPTIENQLYKIKASKMMVEIGMKYEPASDLFERIPVFKDPTKRSKTLLRSINTFDLFGDSKEFELDMMNKLYRVIKDYNGSYAKVKDMLMREVNKPYVRGDFKDDLREIEKQYADEIANKACRGLSKDAIILCAVASGKSGGDSHKSRQLDIEIDNIMKLHKLTNVIEINTVRNTSYFDCSIEGYECPRTPKNTKYTNYSIYGGENLFDPAKKYDDEFSLIIYKTSGISQMLSAYFHKNLLVNNKERKIIVLSDYNLNQNKSRIMLEKTCANDKCSQKACLNPLYVNYYNC